MARFGGPRLEAGRLTRAIGHAVLEDPTLFQHPQRPLDELLYNALEQHADDHHWRDFASVRQEESVSFGISGMPEALDIELRARAEQYGMSTDQYVIAILGFLAWRTPFAEDMASWDSWDPEHLRRRDNVRLLRDDVEPPLGQSPSPTTAFPGEPPWSS